jgi:hypothetical protein
MIKPNKTLLILFGALPLFSGCVTNQTATALRPFQPTNLNYRGPNDDRLWTMGNASKILLEAPTITEYDEETKTTITKPVYHKVKYETIDPATGEIIGTTEEEKPLTLEFWVRDPNVKRPVTLFGLIRDVFTTGGKVWLAKELGESALDGRTNTPEIVQIPAGETRIIAPQGSSGTLREVE